MTATGHAVIGTVIAAKIGNPTLAIPIALASHVVADYFPHWDTATNRKTKTKARFLLYNIFFFLFLFFFFFFFLIFFFMERVLFFFFLFFFAIFFFVFLPPPFFFPNGNFPP